MDGLFRIRFSSKYFDSETGLYYYGYRFYSPALVRWLSRDPIGEEGGLNLYTFCLNVAVNSFDSVGLVQIKAVTMQNGIVRPVQKICYNTGQWKHSMSTS